MLTLASIIKKLSSDLSNFHFDVVYINKANIKQQYLIEIMSLSNVTWHSDISEEMLLALYRQADCFLIPLLDCTANNAILEAVACGIPIVATDLPAIKTYLDDSMSVLCRSVDEFCDALQMLRQSRSLIKKMSANARRLAVENFDWFKVAAKTYDLFKSLS